MLTIFMDYLRAIQLSVKKSTIYDLPWACISPIYCRIFYGIGARDFCLFSLFSKSTSSWPDYISNEPFKSLLMPGATACQRKIADDKLEFQAYCHARQINTPKVIDVAHFDSEQSADVFLRLLNQYEDGKYFAKSRFGSHGAHAFDFEIINGKATSIATSQHQNKFAAILNKLVTSNAEIIIQRRVFNHPSIVALTASESLSTIRVVTVRSGHDIVLIAACARIIVGHHHTDSFVHGQMGNLVAEIDLDNGVIIRCKQSCDKSFPNIVDIEHHPISKARLIGFQIPFWEALVLEVSKAHHAFEGLATVGWDVAITTDSALIIEANWRYDVDLIQVSHDRGFLPLITKYFFNQGTDHEKLNHRHP